MKTRHLWRSAARAAVALGAALFTVLCTALLTVPAWAAEQAGHGSPWLELLWKTINFAVLMGLLIYFLRKPIAGYLARSAGEMKQGLDDARRSAAETAAQVLQQKRNIEGMQAELERMVAAAKADAALELRRMTEEAEAHATKSKAQTALQIEQEVRKARQALQEEIADQTTRIAERLIRARMTPERQQRLVAGYARQMGGQR
ncbi:MAG: ATP synthase F0 subunit B [Candidatus Lambdaproteobacteria bacterium]|nr:ATP synthase F0 subunit B [Candidatus Lambdaproteobacteria bacterium]